MQSVEIEQLAAFLKSCGTRSVADRIVFRSPRAAQENRFFEHVISYLEFMRFQVPELERGIPKWAPFQTTGELFCASTSSRSTSWASAGFRLQRAQAEMSPRFVHTGRQSCWIMVAPWAYFSRKLNIDGMKTLDDKGGRRKSRSRRLLQG